MCKIPQSCHFSCPYTLSFFSAFQKERVVSHAPFSNHYCKWSRMDVPSVLKCKYWGVFPSTKSSGKSQREKTMHNSLNYSLSTAMPSTLIRRSFDIKIEQICCFVLRGIMLSYTLTTGWLILSANGRYWSELCKPGVPYCIDNCVPCDNVYDINLGRLIS